MTSRWRLPTPNLEAISAVATELLLLPAVAQVLIARGFDTRASVEKFLDPQLDDLHDPFLLRDMDRAVARIETAIAGGEQIEIHGDYDVDGVTSTVIVKKALELIGAEAGWHIPHRLHDGYGMQAAAVEEAAARGVNLIISVDNGIRAGAAIARGLELGVEPVVTDHHLPETDPLRRGRCFQTHPRSSVARRMEPRKTSSHSRILPETGRNCHHRRYRS